MRTKHFLTALCLPLAFAACTNDDFVNESNTLEGRGTIDVTLTAARSSYGADTKMSIDDKYQFLWEKDADKIGAALVDGAIAGTPSNNIYVNYPFTADADGNVSTFSGKSAMTQGLYFFYYEYQDVLDRKGLPMGKPNQVYDVASEKTALQQAATYMRMISPVVNLKKGLKYEAAQTYNLNLKFENLYTVVQVNIKSANIPEKVAPKVTKIKLGAKTSNAGTGFKVNAAADMSEVASAGVITLDNEGQIKTDEQTAALAKLRKKIADHTIYSGKQANGNDNATEGEFELNVKGDLVLDAAKATSLYILVPKGTYAELDLTVETSEGSYTRKIESASGIELADKLQPISAELNFAQDGTGNVTLPDNFKIASAEDWASAIKFMTDHAVGYLNKAAEFELTKNVAIESLPIFELTIKGNNKELALTKDYTVSESNKDKFTFDGVNLAVEKGATMTLKAAPTRTAGTTKLEKLINRGTLNVSADINVPQAIDNFGTLNVTTDATISGGLTNGQVENKQTNPATPAYVGKVNVAKEKTLTIEKAKLDNVNGTVAIAAGAMLNIKYNSENQPKGKIEVNGTLKTSESGVALTNMGTIDNFGSLQIAITNKGKVGTKNVNGLFIIEKGSSAAGDQTANPAISGGTVEVKDVDTFVKLAADKKYRFDDAVVTAKVANYEDYKKADGESASTGITAITLTSGEWTIVASGSSTPVGTSKNITVPTYATGLILEGVTLDVQGNLGAAGTPISVSTSGTAASTVKTTADAEVSIVGGVTVGAGSTLVVENKVKVNAYNATADQITGEAAINGTLNVMPGAKMYFKSATVAQGATLTVKGGTSDNKDAGEFYCKDLTNNGTVTSEAGATGKKAGIVYTPKTNTGTINGGSTVDDNDFTIN